LFLSLFLSLSLPPSLLRLSLSDGYTHHVCHCSMIAALVDGKGCPRGNCSPSRFQSS
jgi:hypothetical protein